MNTKKKLVVFATMLAFLIMVPVARATEEDQATKLTFNKAVQVPGRVLPEGTYWFILANTNPRSNVVQIFSGDRSTLYATTFARTTERRDPTDNTEITFADRGSMQPETIVTWFYPGYSSGHEFVYSKPEEKELAQVTHHTVMAMARDRRQAVAALVTGD
jgi:hypothetical protein